jgi:alpha-L-fucosidase 2
MVRRRRLLGTGAAGAGAALLPAGWMAAAGTGSHASPRVEAAGEFVLRYDGPAGTDWLRALPIGNGRLGAMVFGNVDTERLQLNEDTVWAGGPYDSANTRGAANLAEIRRRVFTDQWTSAQDLINQTMMGSPGGQLAYQTVGNLRLAFGGAGGMSQYERTLDLSTATVTTTYVSNGVRHQREVFASAPDQVIVVRLSADRAGAITFSATFDSPQRTTTSSPDGATIALDGVSGSMEGVTGQVRFLALANATVTGGTVSSSGGTLRVSIGSSYVNFRAVNGDYQGIARSRLDAARVATVDGLRARHLTDYQALFGRVSIDLGRTAAADRPTDVRIAQHASVNDPQLSALLFQFGRYLLISSSRPGTQPANLQGIWNDSTAPSWDSKYTINANLPMNYWPADTTNLSECRPSQHRRVAGRVGRRRCAVGDVADRWGVVVHADLGALSVHRRRRVPARVVSGDEGCRPVLSRHPGRASHARIPRDQSVELPGTAAPRQRQRVRRTHDGQPDPA